MASVEAERVDNPSIRSWFGAPGLVVTIATLIVGVGPLGAVASAVLAIGWYHLSAVAVFCIGQIALLIFSPDAPFYQFAAAESGLWIVLIGPLLSGDERWQSVAAFVLAAGALGSIAWLVRIVTDTLWPTALVLGICVALVAYGLHRYERLQLGLLETT